MCDTLYAAPLFSGAGTAWFAKNSDRAPDEPQALCIVPRRTPREGIAVASRIFPGRDAGFAFALSKPSWMAGGEAGVNEAGVAIGNEAVFSRWKPAKDGPLGMDILRAALAASESAAAAARYIASFVEAEGQGGNGAYHGSLYYHNSFIISDPREALVLETSGKRWALRRTGDFASISNAYSITDNYEEVDAQTSRELSSRGGKASFRAYVESRPYLLFTRGDTRRRLTREAIESARGRLDLPAVLGALRAHGSYRPGRPGSLACPCVHEGGFPVNNATTASLALSYPSAGAPLTLWFSGTSYPCISLFKPLLLASGEFIPLWTDYDYSEGSASAYAYWKRQLDWIRRGKAGALSLDEAFVEARDEAQTRLLRLAEAAAGLVTKAGEGGSPDLAELRAETNRVVKAWEGKLEGF